MSIRLGISMTCFSFAKVLRARKFFWICDTMLGGSPYAEGSAPAAGSLGCVAVPRAEKRGSDEEGGERPGRLRARKAAEKRSRPIRNRSLLRGSSAVSALVVHVCDERAPSRRQIPGSELRKPGLRIARPRRREVKSALQVTMPRSPRRQGLPERTGWSGGAQDTPIL